MIVEAQGFRLFTIIKPLYGESLGVSVEKKPCAISESEKEREREKNKMNVYACVYFCVYTFVCVCVVMCVCMFIKSTFFSMLKIVTL